MPRTAAESRPQRIAALSIVALASLLAGCKGGGGGGGGSMAPPPGTGWTAGVFQPAANFDAECAAPRTGIDPQTQLPYPDVLGSTLDENNWLRSWSNDLYLWYGEIQDRDPSLSTTAAYFDLLKTTATTASGAPKDKFHFTYDTDEWIALSQSGVTAGYGVEWVILSGAPPRDAVVAYVEPNSPAATAGLARGARLRRVDNVDFVNAPTQADVDTIVAGLYPDQANEMHTFVVLDLGASMTRPITMVSANVTSTPVQNVHVIDTPTGRVGYMLFNDHILTAEQALIDAVATLDVAPGISDLVLDIRYNGGGYLFIASQLAYMIAGDAQIAGRFFEDLRFNAKHPSTNPITGAPLQPLPFATTTVGISPIQALPTLDLQRVFVLTGPNTCSASESIINSLRGVDVQVVQIGSKTCGKPYGFYPEDNCGTTYFTIEFQGVNAKLFGDYSDGFAPVNSLGTQTTPIPGCSVADDFTRALGNPAESRLAAALAYRTGGAGSCPTPNGVNGPGFSKPGASLDAADGRMSKSPARENRVLGR